MTIGVISFAASAWGERREAVAPATKASASEPRKRARCIKSSRYLFSDAQRVIRGGRTPQGTPVQISIADITSAFPDYRVAFVVAEGLTVALERSAALDALIAERETAARERWSGTELSQI